MRWRTLLCDLGAPARTSVTRIELTNWTDADRAYVYSHATPLRALYVASGIK